MSDTSKQTTTDGDQSSSGANGGGAGGNADTPTPTQPPAGKTYTQAEVDALNIKQQKRTAAAERNKLVEELGLGSVDDLKALVQAKKEAEEATKSETQKALEAAQQAKAEAEAAKRSAHGETLRLKLQVALMAPTGEGDEMQPGVNPEFLDAAMDVALKSAQESDLPIEEAIAAAVEETRKKAAPLFAAPAQGGLPPTPGTPRRPSSQMNGNGTSKKDGAEAFKDWKKTGQRKLAPLPGQTP